MSARFLTSTVRLRTTALAAVAALLAAMLALGFAADTAQARSCKRVLVGDFRIKKIRASAPVSCKEGRTVAKQWVKRDYDDLNPIPHSSGNLWFCSWRRRAPQSQTTGTAECDADPGEAVNFAVRHRRR
ncbi:MAG TPA: hypothetical protein VE401_09160 [Solirubrobacterales bacterium]|jgi:hypothetical protein|nr:hypothetical protein [Solirubrobacterales bacterium]